MRFIILCLGLLVTPLYGQNLPMPRIIESSPTVGDYQSALDKYKKSTKEVFDFASWKGVELNNKKTNEKITFDKLNHFEQHVFCVNVASRLSQEMGILKDFWVVELNKFKDPKHKLIPLVIVEKPSQKAAEAKDIEKYQNELLELRKTFAKEHEKFLEKVFKDFKDEIPEKERELYLRKIRQSHDKDGLISGREI